MAAFSDQQNPLSAYDFLSKNTNIEISGFQEPGFDHYPSCILASETQGLENIKKKLSVHEGELGLIEVGKLVRKSNNGSGFRTREELDSSLVQLGDTDHVFQQSLLEKNRGNYNGFLLNSPQSKEKEVCKGKKLPNGSMGKKEGKKLKKNKKKLEKINEEPPCGYIHVRARRGQATDSHSLAERLRREKINKRMKLLQGLIPGCDKVTGKALLLDEIINYVQSLQNQVEILSMKLSYVNPMFYDFSLVSEGIMVNSEKLRSSNPLIPSLQESSQAHQVVGYEQLATFENPTIFATPSSYHHVLDSSPSILSSDQSTNAFSQDNGNICWKVEDQKPVFIDQDCFKKMGFFL